MQTLVSVRGKLKVPEGNELYVSQTFVAEHQTPQELSQKMQDVMAECFHYGGLTIPIDPELPKDIANIRFWPFDNFRYVWVEKLILTKAFSEQESVQ
jgi:hypothetical protein